VIGLYRSGTSPLHKIGPGTKLLAVVLWITTLSIWGNNPAIWSVALVGVFALFLVAFGSVRFFLKNLWTLRYLVLIGLIPQLIFEGVGPAINNTARLIAGIMVAILFTLTPHSLESSMPWSGRQPRWPVSAFGRPLSA